MKNNLFKYLFICTLILPAFNQQVEAQSTIKTQSRQSDCPVCDKLGDISKTLEGDEKKAANQFADYIATVKLSKKTATKKKELTLLLNLATKLIYKDDRLEIGQYLISFKDEDPKIFDEIVSKMSAEDKKLLNDNDKEMRKFFKDGEPQN